MVVYNDTTTTQIYTLSLHDALPISGRPGSATTTAVSRPRAATAAAKSRGGSVSSRRILGRRVGPDSARVPQCTGTRSEEHTSELQSRQYLVCRLLLETKKSKSLGRR